MSSTPSVSSYLLQLAAVNSNGQHVLYTDAAGGNTLVVTCAYVGPEAGLRLLSGRNPNDPDDGIPTLSFDFSTLLAEDVTARLVTTSLGWQGSYQGSGVWQFRPTGDTVWLASSILTFRFNGLQVATPDRVGTVRVSYQDFPKVPDNAITLAMVVMAGANTAGSTGVQARMVSDTPLVMDSGSGQPQVNKVNVQVTLPTGNRTTPVTGQPCLFVVFPANALSSSATVSNTANLAAMTIVSEDGGWQETSPAQYTGTSVIRTLTYTGNQTLANQHTFTLDNLVIQGAEAGNHQVEIYYTNLPSVNNGMTLLSVPIQNSLVNIITFTATPDTLNNITTPQPVTLAWNVQGATTVTLSGVGVVQSQELGLIVTVEQTTTFILTAFDSSLKEISSATVTVTVNPANVSRLVPKGMILMWSGSSDGIPAGWLLCDGTNNTPNLTDRFILGAGGSQGAGNTGGPDYHTHDIQIPFSGNLPTSNAGQHNHNMPSMWYARNLSCGCHTGVDTLGNENVQQPTSSNGDHNHSFSVTYGSFLSSTNTGTNRPPWYALCFIMKN